MKKRIAIVLITLVLGLGLAGTATATQPTFTTCWMFWLDPAGNFILFEVPGEVVYNEQAQIYNISCSTTFDFNSGEYADIPTLCAWWPEACKPGEQFFRIQNFWWFWGDYDWTQVIYQVNANGQASMHGQVALNQCGSEFRGYNYTYLVPDGYWTPGAHNYVFTFEGITYPVDFTVDENAPLYDGHVRLGLFGLSSEAGPVDSINPAQSTFIQFTHYVHEIDLDYLRWAHDNLLADLSIDSGPAISIAGGPITNYCTRSNPAFLIREWGYGR